MAHANAIFLSLLSGAALVLGLAPGCSNSNAETASAAIIWTVYPGSNSSSSCGAVNDTWQIGNPESNPLQIVANGGTANGVPVSVNCDVTQSGSSYTVVANAQYGTEGALTISGTITTGANGVPNPSSTFSGTFNDNLGLRANMTQSNCNVTFNKNPNMGIAATRIWGFIDCPQVATSNGDSTCDGTAEFLFEYCGQ
jgi:hypothetical protein